MPVRMQRPHLGLGHSTSRRAGRVFGQPAAIVLSLNFDREGHTGNYHTARASACPRSMQNTHRIQDR